MGKNKIAYNESITMTFAPTTNDVIAELIRKVLLEYYLDNHI